MGRHKHVGFASRRRKSPSLLRTIKAGVHLTKAVSKITSGETHKKTKPLEYYSKTDDYVPFVKFIGYIVGLLATYLFFHFYLGLGNIAVGIVLSVVVTTVGASLLASTFKINAPLFNQQEIEILNTNNFVNDTSAAVKDVVAFSTQARRSSHKMTANEIDVYISKAKTCIEGAVFLNGEVQALDKIAKVHQTKHDELLKLYNQGIISYTTYDRNSSKLHTSFKNAASKRSRKLRSSMEKTISIAKISVKMTSNEIEGYTNRAKAKIEKSVFYKGDIQPLNNIIKVYQGEQNKLFDLCKRGCISYTIYDRNSNKLLTSFKNAVSQRFNSVNSSIVESFIPKPHSSNKMTTKEIDLYVNKARAKIEKSVFYKGELQPLDKIAKVHEDEQSKLVTMYKQGIISDTNFEKSSGKLLNSFKKGFFKV